MGKLLLLFTVVPLVELYLLIWLSGQVGFGATVGIVLLTGVLGAAMARAEGLRVVRSWQLALAEGRLPEEGVVSGLMVLVGGVLLVTPGVLTDVLGFLLLFPLTRRAIAAVVRARVQGAIDRGTIQVVRGPGMQGGTHVHVERHPGGVSGSARAPRRPREIIDVEGEVVDERRDD